MKLNTFPYRQVIYVVFFGVLGLPATSYSQEVGNSESEASVSASYQIPGSEVFDVRSKQGLDYRIFLSIPDQSPPPEGFPVLFVLDGNAYFPLAATLSRFQARGPRSGLVIVGIGYPTDDAFHMQRRTFDMTTKADPKKLPPSRGGRGWHESGGADQFLEFIKNELRPLVAKKVAIDGERHAIVGHSFGGLFVMHTLFTHPNSFQTYIAISPSGWWNDYALLQEEKVFSRDVDSLEKPVRLLIEVGELELSGKEGPAASLAPTPAMKEFGTTEDFAKRLSSVKSKSCEVRFKIYDGESHGSVVPRAMIDAIRFSLPPTPPSAARARTATN
ncbi:alpha/beta hydrolase [Blastopirellula marina]|nr:alpha/beta hydrolase-fold protein [Blastopirellula marina]